MLKMPQINTINPAYNKIVPDFTKSLKVGQILNARTEVGGEALSKVTLRVGQQLLTSQTPVPLKTGEQVSLLVKKAGNTPLLSILSKSDNRQIIAENIKQFIARQTDIKTLIQTSTRLINHPALPQTIRQPLQNLINNTPSLGQLINPQQLKLLINNNSFFLESRLLRNAGLETNLNFKAQILRINNLLLQEEPSLVGVNKQSPSNILKLINQFIEGKPGADQLIKLTAAALPEIQIQQLLSFLMNSSNSIPKSDFTLIINHLLATIKKHNRPAQAADQLRFQLERMLLLRELKTAVTDTLARITTQQLITMTRESDNPVLLLFDLLFRDNKYLHLIELEIERNQNSKDKNKQNLSVTLKINFEELGTIRVKINLIENRISALFHANEIHTLTTIRNNIGLLESALTKAGFEITFLEAHQQTIKPMNVMPDNIRLLDEKA